MTERKPAGTSWESWIDIKIRDAEAKGAFDNLPGAGRPLPDHGREYDENWWLKRFLEREKLSVLPETLELKLLVQKEQERILKLSTETAVRREIAKLNKTIKARIAKGMSGPASRTTVVDGDAFVARWKSQE